MSRIVLSLILAVTSASARSAERDTSHTVTSSTPAVSSLKLPTSQSFSKQHASFDSYWYRGFAELTRYALRQARYGEQYEGEAVLIFVTEDFLPDPQVKQERGRSPDALSVLKLNAYRRFYTGIYPYTLMTSSFTPAASADSRTLKDGPRPLARDMQNGGHDGLAQIKKSVFFAPKSTPPKFAAGPSVPLAWWRRIA